MDIKIKEKGVNKFELEEGINSSVHYIERDYISENLIGVDGRIYDFKKYCDILYKSDTPCPITRSASVTAEESWLRKCWADKGDLDLLPTLNRFSKKVRYEILFLKSDEEDYYILVKFFGRVKDRKHNGYALPSIAREFSNPIEALDFLLCLERDSIGYRGDIYTSLEKLLGEDSRECLTCSNLRLEVSLFGNTLCRADERYNSLDHSNCPSYKKAVIEEYSKSITRGSDFDKYDPGIASAGYMKGIEVSYLQDKTLINLSEKDIYLLSNNFKVATKVIDLLKEVNRAESRDKRKRLKKEVQQFADKELTKLTSNSR